MCFLTSADAAADPPVNHASAIPFELSGEITVRSRAAGLLQNQNVSRPSVTVVMVQPTSSFTFNTSACPMKWLSQHISDIIVSDDNISSFLTCCKRGGDVLCALNSQSTKIIETLLMYSCQATGTQSTLGALWGVKAKPPLDDNLEHRRIQVKSKALRGDYRQPGWCMGWRDG